MPPKLSKPAALAVNIKAVLDVLPRDKLTNKQQDDLDAMTDALQVLQLMEKKSVPSSARSDPGGHPQADLGSEVGSNASSAASTGAASAATTGAATAASKKRARRRSNKEAYGQRPRGDLVDAASLEDAEACDQTIREGQAWWCQDSYWVTKNRLGWCRSCGELDDLKVMYWEYVERLSIEELRRHTQGQQYNPLYPELRKGKNGETKVYTCSRCYAKTEGIDEALAVSISSRRNKGPGSITHGRDRVKKFKEIENDCKDILDVLVGFVRKGDVEPALRRSTEGVGVGFDPSSTGARPATEEVATEVGRSMGVASGPGSPCVPPPPSEGEDADWNMLEDRRRPKWERNRGNGPPEPARFSEPSRGPGSPNLRGGSQNPAGGSENLVPGRVRRTRPVLVARSPYCAPLRGAA